MSAAREAGAVRAWATISGYAPASIRDSPEERRAFHELPEVEHRASLSRESERQQRELLHRHEELLRLSRALDDAGREEKARALGADEFCVKPIERGWLLKRLRGLGRAAPVEKLLVIDDDEVARYLIRRMLIDTTYAIVEAEDGASGVVFARRERPQIILLDFVLPDMTAFDVIDELKRDPETRGIPIIVHTSRELAEEERACLSAETSAILSKQSLSREVAGDLRQRRQARAGARRTRWARTIRRTRGCGRTSADRPATSRGWSTICSTSRG